MEGGSGNKIEKIQKWAKVPDHLLITCSDCERRDEESDGGIDPGHVIDLISHHHSLINHQLIRVTLPLN